MNKKLSHSDTMSLTSDKAHNDVVKKFGKSWKKQGKGTDKDTIYYTDKAQDYFNERYDFWESKLTNQQ